MRITILTVTILSTQIHPSLTFTPYYTTTTTSLSTITTSTLTHFLQNHHRLSSTVTVASLSTSSDTTTSAAGDGGGTTDEGSSVVSIPSFVQSDVLKKVYPAIVRHMDEYGNPNIPLGSKDGKYCKTLRRMAFQESLSAEEIQHLTDMGFVWNGFEGVYDEADFDDCLHRLLRYEEEFKTNYQIPKKYKPDPELGAWVTVIRRIGRANIELERRDKLDSIGFSWKSTRKCGSAFMSTYKELRSRLESCCEQQSYQPSNVALEEEEDVGVVTWEVVDPDGLEAILGEDVVRNWIVKQKVSMEEGTLSEARCTYMDQLPGFDWRLWEC